MSRCAMRAPHWQPTPRRSVWISLLARPWTPRPPPEAPRPATPWTAASALRDILGSRRAHPSAPSGVLDRVSLDMVVVVPDGALPLRGGPYADVHPDVWEKDSGRAPATGPPSARRRERTQVPGTGLALEPRTASPVLPQPRSLQQADRLRARYRPLHREGAPVPGRREARREIPRRARADFSRSRSSGRSGLTDLSPPRVPSARRASSAARRDCHGGPQRLPAGAVGVSG